MSTSTPPRPRNLATEETPRTMRTSGVDSSGNTLTQVHIRSEIARENAKEIVRCTVDQFFAHYLSFASNNEALIQPRLKELSTESPPKDWILRKYFNNTRPSASDANENRTFSCLKSLGDDLKTGIEARNNQRIKFLYMSQPHTTNKDEKGVNDAMWDGFFCKYTTSQTANIPLSDISAIGEFKKNNVPENIKQNRWQLITGANTILNDDPRRLFMYGFTIEDTSVSMWYFSRSHSAVSQSFDFTKDPGSLVKFFVAIMLASEEEIGYDPSVERVRIPADPSIAYVYMIEDESKVRYFQTISTIYELRRLCLTGRGTRVWKAKEVSINTAGAYEIINGAEEVVLREVWIDEGAQTEREIQNAIFKDLDGIKDDPTSSLLKHFSERPRAQDYKKTVTEALKDYRRFFLTIECDSKGAPSKVVVPGFQTEDIMMVSGKIKKDKSKSSQASRVLGADPTRNNASPAALPVNIPIHSVKSLAERRFKSKQISRTIYREVCSPIDDREKVKTINVAIAALRDCMIALTLLYLAGWVHRDISTGNVLVYSTEGGGKVQGKLADFEYAKRFPSTDAASADPKTGTAFFMPCEILSGHYLRIRTIEQLTDDESDEDTESSVPRPQPKPVMRHNFQHDLESLWWLTLWMIFTTENPDHLTKAYSVFSPSNPLRRDIFETEEGLQDSILCHLADLRAAGPVLEKARLSLLRCYLKINDDNNQNQVDKYAKIHWNMGSFFDKLIAAIPQDRANLTISKPSERGNRSGMASESKNPSKRPRKE